MHFVSFISTGHTNKAASVRIEDTNGLIYAISIYDSDYLKFTQVCSYTLKKYFYQIIDGQFWGKFGDWTRTEPPPALSETRGPLHRTTPRDTIDVDVASSVTVTEAAETIEIAQNS